MDDIDVTSSSVIIKTSKTTTGVIFSFILLVTGMPIIVNNAWADDHTSVPTWTKQISDWWSQGKISDLESVNAFRYMVDNKVIQISGLSFDHNVSFDKQVQQTRMLSSFLWDESDKPVDFKLGNNTISNSKLHFIYVQPAPSWAPYAGNLVLNATNYWENIVNTKFHYSPEPDKTSITVSWLKEPDSKYVGYTVGKAVEVALGDSRCDGTWHNYDTSFVADTLRHELGHALGFTHSENMGNVMYPIISGEKYAPIKQDLVIEPNKSVFVHVCTNSHTATFHYTLESSNTKNQLDVFFVPSKMESDQFVHDKKFNHYSNDGCFGTASSSYDNTCSNVSNEGGLLIYSSNNFQSQQNITLVLEEK